MRGTKLNGLGAFHEGELNVIIETPKGSRNKFNYDEETGLFKLGGVLPAGASFPFDFGFVPSTLGGDGDPLDVLVLMDEPAFAGCLVRALEALGDALLDEIEHFFVSYNDFKGKRFNPLGRFGPRKASELVKEGMKEFAKSKRRKKRTRR